MSNSKINHNPVHIIYFDLIQFLNSSFYHKYVKFLNDTWTYEPYPEYSYGLFV